LRSPSVPDLTYLPFVSAADRSEIIANANKFWPQLTRYSPCSPRIKLGVSLKSRPLISGESFKKALVSLGSLRFGQSSVEEGGLAELGVGGTWHIAPEADDPSANAFTIALGSRVLSRGTAHTGIGLCSALDLRWKIHPKKHLQKGGPKTTQNSQKSRKQRA